MPCVDVIIPVRDRNYSVLRAIGSVLKQKAQSYRITVVDDGSTDGTSDAVRYFFSDINFIQTGKRGVSAARNTGILATGLPYIAFLDSDDEWKPGKLGSQLEYMESQTGCQISQTEEVWIRNGRRVNPKKYHKKKGGNIFRESLERCMITPSSVILRRSLLDKKGLFDESLPACEDYDFWLRITHDTPIGLVREKCLVRYGGHPDQLSFSIKTLDRYRIIAMINLIQARVLSAENLELAVAELEKKVFIYTNGCRKRGKSSEALCIEKKYEKIKSEILSGL
ncbi:MAG: glycosyltransferase family 2 protein [Fibrobacterota bacterium]